MAILTKDRIANPLGYYHYRMREKTLFLSEPEEGDVLGLTVFLTLSAAMFIHLFFDRLSLIMEWNVTNLLPCVWVGYVLLLVIDYTWYHIYFNKAKEAQLSSLFSNETKKKGTKEYTSFSDYGALQ